MFVLVLLSVLVPKKCLEGHSGHSSTGLENDDYFHKSLKYWIIQDQIIINVHNWPFWVWGKLIFNNKKFRSIFCWTLMSRHNVSKIPIFGKFLKKNIILLLNLIISSMFRQYSYKKSKFRQFYLKIVISQAKYWFGTICQLYCKIKFFSH